MSSHTYIIAVYALGKQDPIDITKDEFDEIRDARQFNAFGLALEEKLDLLVENYADVERELLDMAVQHSIFSGSIDELLTDARHRINRRMINLLTSVRLYHDQIAHALNRVYGKSSSALKQFRSFSSKEYDSSLSYRAIEALRNHVQHASLPVTAISFPMSAVARDTSGPPPGAPTKISYKVTPYIGLQDLEDNKDFKRNILEELKTISNKKGDIEMLPLVRHYMSSIGRIHKSLRSICKDNLEFAEKTITKYRDRALKDIGQLSEGLAAIQCTPEGLYADYEYLTDRPQKRWRYLQSKNCRLEQAAINFVTSEHD